MIVLLVSMLATMIYGAWLLSALALATGYKTDRIRSVYHELKPFYWPLVVLMYLPDLVHRELTFSTIWGVGWAIVGWFAFRNVDDDDRWRRRHRKLKSRIKQLGGRLTVVPVGA